MSRGGAGRQRRDERRASIRIALRLAFRSAARSVGRSALIAVMIALPVAGLTGISTVYASAQPTDSEKILPNLGQNEAELLVVSAPSESLRQSPTSLRYEDTASPLGEFRDPADVLPPGTDIIALSSTRVTATTRTGVGTFTVTEGTAWADSFAGKFDIVEGRAPRSDSEIMVTPSLLPRLGVDIGGVVELRDAAIDAVTVVGLLDDRSAPDSEQAIFARFGVISGLEQIEPQSSTFYLPDTALDWEAVTGLNDEGIIALSKAVLLDPPTGLAPVADYETAGFFALAAVVAMVAGLAAFEVILLAGAAFTVTARQQQRMLATVASVGAPRRLLFRILAANGIVLGVIGGVAGVLIGIGAAAVYQLATGNGSSTQYYGFHVPWLALVGFVAFAVVIGWVASLAPARAASRFDIVAALRGSRRPPVASRRRPAVGLVMLLAGIAVTALGGIGLAVLMQAGQGMGGGHPLLFVPIVLLVLGPVLGQLGLVLCGPLVLTTIATASRNASLGLRLAARDAARNPTRAVPALSAVMTTVFIAVLAMCMVSAGQENSRLEHQYQVPLGTVAVPLSYIEWDEVTGGGEVVRYPHANAVETALGESLDVDEFRVLDAVADPWWSGIPGDEGDPNGVAVPVVPPANLCPWSPGSPEYGAWTADPSSQESKDARTDWRCQSTFMSLTGGTGGHIFVGDADDLALAIGAEPSATAQAALKAGDAVSLYRDYVLDGVLRIEWWDEENAAHVGYGGQEGRPLRSVTVDAVIETPEHPYFFGVFVSRETADELGLDYGPAVALASTATLPSEADRDALANAMYNLPENANGSIYAQLELGPPQYAKIWTWGLLALTAVIALAAAAVAIGLARFDGRQDDATLASLGARGSVRRSFAFWQAVIITGAGAVFGAVIGIVPAVALSADEHWPFTPPWLQIGLAVLVLPVVIALGSWLVAGRGRVIARRMTIA